MYLFCENKTIQAEVHPEPLDLSTNQNVHVPETQPENINTNSSSQTVEEEEDNDCFIVPESTGKYISQNIQQMQCIKLLKTSRT